MQTIHNLMCAPMTILHGLLASWLTGWMINNVKTKWNKTKYRLFVEAASNLIPNEHNIMKSKWIIILMNMEYTVNRYTSNWIELIQAWSSTAESWRMSGECASTMMIIKKETKMRQNMRTAIAAWLTSNRTL